jgi:hypothetical protein
MLAMPRAKAHKNSPKPRSVALKARAAATRKLGGIPLRRKTVWAVDADSPEFRKARRRDRAAARAAGADRDGMAFVEAALEEAATGKWWK